MYQDDIMSSTTTDILFEKNAIIEVCRQCGSETEFDDNLRYWRT